ncbi:MAG: phospholipase D-like domain-containing protein [Promethearchaeota archaeon]
MFPAVALFLIIGSVILMLLWEFYPFLQRRVFPFFIDLLSVAEEKQIKFPIYLASTTLNTEYSMLVKSAKHLILIGVPQIPAMKFKSLLKMIDEEVSLRGILSDKQELEILQRLGKQLDLTTEIIHRPRIHFKLLATEERVAVGSTPIFTKDLENTHDLTLISSDFQIAKDARRYVTAFFEGASGYPKEKLVPSITTTLPRKTESIFVNTSNGLNDLVHGLLSSAKDSVLLVSPYITNDITGYLLNIIPRAVQVRFITTVNWQHWIAALSDPEALEILLSDRVIIYDCPNLMANAIIVDNEAAIISSQNLTTPSWFSHDEAGIFTRNSELITAIVARIESWQPKTRLTMDRFEQEIATFDSALKDAAEPSAQIVEVKEVGEVPAGSDGEPLAPPLLGFASLPQPKPLITTVPQQGARPVPVQAIDEPKWLEDIVYVGKKRTIEYVRACQHQIKRKGSVTIRARGKLIYRAVDIAEQLRMLEELKLILNRDSIKIETYYPIGKETKWGGISQIAITLHKKN